MSERIIKCRKRTHCYECDQPIEYGDRYKRCVEEVGNTSYVINFCIGCVERHEAAKTECKKGNHSFIHECLVEYESLVPYPNYTGELVCENCGVNKKDT